MLKRPAARQRAQTPAAADRRAVGFAATPALRDSAAPLYRQVYLALRDAIFRGAFAEGAVLPSESELVQSFGVSRITVRRALDELVARGLVLRAQGRSTRVRRDIGTAPIMANVDGLLENSLAMGFRTKVEVLEHGFVPAPAAVATALAVARGTEVQMAVRVRRLEGLPISHLTTFLPPEIGSRITREDLGEQPVLSLLERLGVTVTHAEQVISAEAATPGVAVALEVPAGTALLKIERTVISDAGRPVEFIRGLYPPDRYSYRMKLQRVGRSRTRQWRTIDKPHP